MKGRRMEGAEESTPMGSMRRKKPARRKAYSQEGAEVGVTELVLASSSAVTSTSARPGSMMWWKGGGVDVAIGMLPSRSTATCTPPRAFIGVTDVVVLSSFAITSMRPGAGRAGGAGRRNGTNDARDGDAGREGDGELRGPTALRAPGSRTHHPGARCIHHAALVTPVSTLVSTTLTHTLLTFIVAPMSVGCV